MFDYWKAFVLYPNNLRNNKYLKKKLCLVDSSLTKLIDSPKIKIYSFIYKLIIDSNDYLA